MKKPTDNGRFGAGRAASRPKDGVQIFTVCSPLPIRYKRMGINL